MKKIIDFSEICDKPVKELMGQYRVIGTGSSRIVFDIDDKYVLKKPWHKERGSVQSYFEISLYMDTKSSRLCPIIYNTVDCIVAAKTIPLSTPYDKLPVNVDQKKFKNFRILLRKMETIWNHQCNDPEYVEEMVPDWKKIKSSKVYKDIEFLSCYYDLCMDDIWRHSSWGYYRGYFVLIDYGLNKENFDKYYR